MNDKWQMRFDTCGSVLMLLSLAAQNYILARPAWTPEQLEAECAAYEGKKAEVEELGKRVNRKVLASLVAAAFGTCSCTAPGSVDWLAAARRSSDSVFRCCCCCCCC